MRKTTVVCLLMALAGLPAHAAPQPAQSWQLIDKQENQRIAIDKARIFRMPNGNTAAWSRLTLGFDIPDAHTGVRYNAIEALNSYNCKKREYMTLKRVYVDAAGQPVREEKVDSPRIVEIGDGSFEEKLLPEVCKPRAVGEMKALAEQVVAVMNPPAAPARAAEAMTVSDKPAKRSMIDLPRIDPSMVDNPEIAPKPAPPKPAVKPLSKAAPKTETVKPEAPKTEEKAPEPLPAKPADTPARKPAAADAPNYHTGNVSRAEIERQLATFGPRKPRTTTPTTKAKPEKAAAASPNAHVHWAYDGKGGPENWHHLSPDNKACAAGKRQSPIDIKDGIRVDLEPIHFNYGPAAYSVIDNGHTVQVNVSEGLTLRVMERTYLLTQFHFHKPAEERVNGRSYDMVAHLVHRDADGRLAVVAVLMEKGPEHPLIQTIWNNLPLEQGMLVSPSAPLDLNKLLPEKRDYWTYMGSLTTPPCTEDVLWMVLKQPLAVSAEQIAIFGRLYPQNARPIQPANNRLIKESR